MIFILSYQFNVKYADGENNPNISVGSGLGFSGFLFFIHSTPYKRKMLATVAISST
jgi:hypothetical protein